MIKIYVKTTEACNLQCDHCYVGDRRNNDTQFDEIKTVEWINKYIEVYRHPPEDVAIIFHGGEPFLVHLDKIHYIIDHVMPGVKFNTTTNLMYHLTDDHLNLMKNVFVDDRGIPWMHTSWDYKIRFKTDEQLKLWENNVKTLLKYGIDPMVNIVLTKPLISETTVMDLIEYFSNIGVSRINFERLTKITTPDETLIPDYDKQDEWLCEFYDKLENHFSVFFFDEIARTYHGIFLDYRKRDCMKNVITINPDGTIAGCLNSAVLGAAFTNISEEPNTAYASKKYKCLRTAEAIGKMKCYECDIFKYCNGDCYQLSWVNGRCATPKKLYKKILHDVEIGKYEISI